MKKNKFLFFTFLLIFLSSNIISAQNSTCVYFFHGDGCQHCAKIESQLKNIEFQNKNSITLQTFEIYNNRSNMILLNNYFDKFNISNSNRGIPAVIIGTDFIIGDTPILENIENLIEKNKGANCPSIQDPENKNKSQKEKLNSLSMLTIIGAAIVDSINPCAIAVLLILTGALLSTGNKKKTLKAGFAFTSSIYIAYFLFGLGLFSAIQISGLSYWFYKIIGILAIIIGLANIKDSFWYGGAGFVMEIPRNWRPRLKKLLNKVTSPLGAFLMGFVVCLFELPCTGGPYIVILGLLADKMTLFASIPLLLLYNLVFILPLIIITLLIYFGFANVENAAKWKDNNIKRLHLIAGIIMLGLGILITTGFI